MTTLAVATKGMVFNIQRFSVQDGPGIRSTVFSKGCPLRCIWCSNPESQKHSPQLAHVDVLCNNCGKCVEVCEQKAIQLMQKGVKVDRQLCNDCGKCVDVCYPGALRILGKEMSVEEVLEEVRRDELYYRNSGGGATVSGGEPLTQPDFAVAFMKRCRQTGIHTCLDTCGYGPPDRLERMLEHTDLVLYDLKHMNSGIHEKFTGVGNELILDNARLVAARGVPMVIRIPLIPAVNDSEGNISATVNFVLSLNHTTRVDLLPYHRFGVGKYTMLDMPYELAGLPSLNAEAEEVERLKQLVRSYGLDCECGG